MNNCNLNRTKKTCIKQTYIDCKVVFHDGGREMGSEGGREI